MRKIISILFILVTSSLQLVFAQGADCSTASPFCTAAGTATFPASQNTTAPVGPDYGCLFSQPNPAWYYLQVATSGPITLNMTNSANVDIDFIVWGPFTSATAACASGLSDPLLEVDCSYSSSSNETGTIPSAIVGEVYVLLITNYSNQATTISLAQTGGTGATNCNIVCLMDSITVTQGACVSPTNLYDITGTLFYTAPPTSGTLTISNSANTVTQVFNAPFNMDSVSYTLAALPADGNACTITAEFSADPTCTVSKTVTSPPPCFVDCPIIVDSAHTCDGVPAVLTASGANSYIWSTGDTSPSILASGVPATYTVIGITGTCADTATAVVTVFSKPNVVFTADSLVGCGDLTVNFDADTTGNMGATYSWNFGYNDTVATGMSTTYHYPDAGCFTVTLTASLGQGCTTTDSVSCMINVWELPQADFSVSPSDLDAIASTAYFSDLSLNATQWLWSFGDSTFSTVQQPEHTYTEVGTYPVILYISNPNGCTDSVVHNVNVKDIVTFYAPNSFTPNKNEKNEIFYLYSYGVLSEGYELLVFDRWGKQVFKTTDINEGWNGSLNNTGTVLNADTYVYRVSYKEATGKRKNVIGHVNLIR